MGRTIVAGGEKSMRRRCGQGRAQTLESEEPSELNKACLTSNRCDCRVKGSYVEHRPALNLRLLTRLGRLKPLSQLLFQLWAQTIGRGIPRQACVCPTSSARKLHRANGFYMLSISLPFAPAKWEPVIRCHDQDTSSAGRIGTSRALCPPALTQALFAQMLTEKHGF